MGDIKVSVVIPIYNVEEYLPQCLNSVVGQTLKEIEVIMVNDGSTDSSEEIATKYESIYDNFILINKNNEGLSCARNNGINIAKGEYVVFLDSDDYLDPNALKELYNYSKKKKLDLVKFSAFTFQDGTREYKWSDNNGYKYKGTYNKVYTGRRLYMITEENKDHFASCCLIFIRRELIIDHKLKFIKGIVNEDEFFYFELMTLAKRCSVLNKPLYYRRYRKGSIMQTDDFLNKNRSLCIGFLNLNRFIRLYKLQNNSIYRKEITLLFDIMVNNWEKMCKKDKILSKKYFFRIKPIISRYGFCGRISVRIFYINTTFYSIFTQMLSGIGRIQSLIK